MKLSNKALNQTRLGAFIMRKKETMKMKKYQKTALIEVIGHADNGDYLVQNEGQDNDQWMIEKDVFESTYEEAAKDFGWAIRQLKKGHKVARAGWNGKRMWLRYVNERNYTVDAVRSGSHSLLPWIGMKTADDHFVPWLASQTDVLAVDWEIAK